MSAFDDPRTFRGQLQRGRGIAVRRAPDLAQAGDAVYECILDDPRWDRQTESRDAYLAGLVRDLDLPLVPIEEHLAAFDGDPGDIDLLLDVLAALAAAGREDAASLLRRHAPGSEHDNSGEPPGRLRAQAAANHRRLRQTMADTPREELLRQVATGTTRRLALEELGRRGDLIVLDLVEDPGLRTAAGWMPGSVRALTSLGAEAVPRARLWLSDVDLSELAIHVLAASGDHCDVLGLISALQQAFDDDDLWCFAEIPAAGLGRLQVAEAAPLLSAAWEKTLHSHARAPFLTALHRCAPHAAVLLADEGLDDCEPAVRQIARALRGGQATRGVDLD